MAAHDSHSQREFFPCSEGLQQPAAAAQLMAPTPQALHHWPATAAAAIAHTGPQAAAAVPSALAPAQLQQAQHAQLMLPYGHTAVHGGQYVVAYPLCGPGLPHQAPAAAAVSSSSGAAPTQPLPLQLGALHIPHIPAAQPQQGGVTGLLYVNQKQLASILRRRAKRQKQEAENKLPRVRKVRAAHRPALPTAAWNAQLGRSCARRASSSSWCALQTSPSCLCSRPAALCEPRLTPARQGTAPGRERQVPEVGCQQGGGVRRADHSPPLPARLEAQHGLIVALCSKGEIEAQERREGDLANRADARLGQAQLPGRQQERQAGDDGNGGRGRHAPGPSPPQQEPRHEAATLNEQRGVEQPADESL